MFKQILKMKQMKESSLAVLSIMNGMLGGPVLVLPVLALSTGYLLGILVPLVMGLINFYTLSLIITHSKNYESVYDAIVDHFNSRRSGIIYNTMMAIINSFTLITYFTLICKQVEGYDVVDGFVGPMIFGLFLLLTVLESYLHLGQKIMGIGFISNFIIVLFIFYELITAPGGENTVPVVGEGALDLSATMMMAFSTHTWAYFVLRRTTQRDNFLLCSAWSYGLGIILYIFFCMGSFGLVNRTPRVEIPSIIQEYFPSSNWQINLVETMYLIHFLTVFPEFLIVIKRRVLEAMEVEQIQEFTWQAFFVFFVIIFFGFLIYENKVGLTTLIQINGSFGQAINTVIIPIALHWKCVHFNTSFCACQESENSKENSIKKVIEIIWHIVLIIGSLSLATITILKVMTTEIQ